MIKKFPLFLGLSFLSILEAATFIVSSNSDPTSNPSTSTLRGAMLNAKSGDVIQITTSSTITLTNPLPAVVVDLTIQGSGGVRTIDGASSFQIFSVATGTLTLQDLQLNNGLSKGGNGGSGVAGANGGGGGGGGAGGGGGLHIHYGATAIINNVSFSGNTAQGGDGGSGAVTTNAINYGGGGGGGGYGSQCSFSGHTGNGANGALNVGGGGGGANTAGGIGGQTKSTSPVAGGVSGVILGGGGGGGGGYLQSSNPTPESGALAYNAISDSSPSSFAGGGFSTSTGAGGGGAGAAGAGNPGSGSGGGSGGIGVGSDPYGGFGGGGGGGSGGTVRLNGGVGTGAGGGGGGCSGSGGAGGQLGGGGGGGSSISNVQGVFTNGGQGGFGGGGGGGYNKGTSIFGGGDGASLSSFAGGGGAAMGGAVFVQTGGLLVIQTSPGGGFGSGNLLTAGSGGGTGAQNGNTYGPDLFLRSGGTMRFDNVTNWTFSQDIVSNQGTGGDSGGGLIIGSNSSVTGTTILSGSNSYTGSTQINGGTLSVGADGNLGASSGGVGINDQGIFEINNSFATSRVITLSGSATIEVDPSQTLTTNTAIQGTGSLTKIGTGILLCNASNTYTGGTVIAEGTLKLGAGTLLPTGKALTVGTTFASGAIFDMSTAGVNQTIGDLSGSSFGSISLGNSQLIFGTNNSTSFSGTISSGASGSIQKVGFGTVSLLGSSSYTGGTVLTAGGLAINQNSSLGAAAGVVSVKGNATLQFLNGSITLANPIAIDPSQTLTLNTNFSTTISGNISEVGASGSVIKSGNGNLSLTGTNSYTGGTTIQTGTLSLVNSGILASTGPVNVQTGAIFDISGSAVTDQVIGALTGGGSVNLGSNVSQVLTFGSGASSTYSFSGSISGSGSIEKTGSGVAIFTGTNSYLGTTTITQGTLSLQGTDPTLPSSATVDVKTGATFDISGSLSPTQTIGQLQGDAGSFVTLGSKQLIFGSNVAPTTFSGTIQGTGSILKEGTGTVTLAGTNSYTGGTIIQEGTLSLSGGSSLSSSGPLTIGTSSTVTSATFDIASAGDQSVGTLSGTTLGVIELGNNKLTIGGGAAASDSATFAGTINDTGAGSIEKQGLGTVILSGINTYAGGTFLGQGTLEMTNNQSLGTGGIEAIGNATLNIAGTFTLSNPIIIDASETLTIYTDFNPTLSGQISESASSGALLKAGTGTLILTNGSNSYTGGTTIQEGTFELGVGGSLASTGAVIVGTSLTQASAVFDVSLAGASITIGDLSGSEIGSVVLSNSSAQTLTFGTNNAGPFVFAGEIVGSQGAILKQGSSVTIFTAGSSYLGGTTITGGTLSLQGPSGSLASSGDVTVNSPGTFDIGASGALPSQIIGNLIGSGNVTLGANVLQFGGTTNATFSGVISGSGSILKKNSATAFFSGQNTFTGPTEIQEGTLSITRSSDALCLTSSSGVKIDSGATFDISDAGAFSSQQIGTLSGSGDITLGDHELIFGRKRSSIFSGQITGSLLSSIEKRGIGAMIFTGNSSVGSTTIHRGLLAINGTLTSPAVTVDAGATLAGTGTIVGAVTVSNLGIIKPGNSVGTLHVGGLTLSPSSKTLIEISPTLGSEIDVQNAAALDGNLLIFAHRGLYADNVSYVILEANSLSGAFNAPVYAPGSLNLGAMRLIYDTLSSPNTVTLAFGTIPIAIIHIDCLTHNPNGLNVANYLNQFVFDPILGPIVFDLSTLSCFQLNNAINSISPARNAIAGFVSQNEMFLIASTVSCRMSQQRFSMRNSQMEKEIGYAPLPSKTSAKEAFGLLSQSEQISLPQTYLAEPYNEENLLETYESSSEEKPFKPYGGSQIAEREEAKFAFWTQGLVDSIGQNAQSVIPGYSSLTGGALLGCDYYGKEEGLLGAAVCYARSSIQQDQSAGSSIINYYAATLYGTAYLGDGYLEIGLAGALNQFSNERFITFPQVGESPFSSTAKSSYWGGQAVPHVALGYDLNFSWGTLEPFISIDCAMLYQPSFSEKGASPLNMRQKSAFSELLRSEIGFHLYEVCKTSFGDFVFRESFSFVNKEPFDVGLINAGLVGYPGSFTVNSFTSNLSLISPSIQIFYRSPSGIFSSLFYVGEFQIGSGSYISNSALFKLGYYF